MGRQGCGGPGSGRNQKLGLGRCYILHNKLGGTSVASLSITAHKMFDDLPLLIDYCTVVGAKF